MFVVCFLLTVACSGLLQGQTATTMGKDFWLSFMRGRIEATMSVTITGTHACTGTISNTQGWSQTFSVPANGSVTIDIDNAKCYNTVSNAITNKGIHIVTTDTVSVYASNFLSSSFDVTFVMPTPVLRDEYMIQTFQTWQSSYQSEVLIVATEDSTIIDITPTASTIGLSGTSTITKTLNTGQCYLMQCGQIGDYSGTKIKARDCKRIAVFNGHHCAHIPPQMGTYCDHLFEESVPVAYWGKHFVATMSSHHYGDYVKITSLYDSCDVYVGGTLAGQINVGESYTFTLQSSSSGPVGQYSRYIETTQPATVYTYMESKNVAGPDGDPSMMFIPPIEQRLKDVVFVSYNNQNQLTQYHHVNITARAEDVSSIQLDNSSIGSYFQSVSGNSNYSFARIQTTTGSHRLHCNNCDGFVAYAYGVGSNESYGYAVGFAAKPIGVHLYVNDEEFEMGDTLDACFGDTVHSYLVCDDTITVVNWLRDGAVFSVDDTLIVNCALAGYSKYSVVYTISDNCYANYDTMSFIVAAKNMSESQFDTTACVNGFVWDGVLYDSTGAYMRVFSNQYGCDSVVVMSLQILNEVYDTISSVACDSAKVNGTTYYSSGYYLYDTQITSGGCDSITIMDLTINHSYFKEVSVSIFYGDTLHWIDGGDYCSADDHPTFTYQSIDGCDSVIRLNLNIIKPEIPEEEPVIDSFALWVPNVFTPSENSNNRFCIYTSGVTEARVYIFNRMGLYVTDFDGLSQCWDGTYKGEPCKGETYVYRIEYIMASMPRIVQEKIGTVTLLR